MSDSPKPLGAIYSNPRRKQDGSTTPRSGGDRSVGRPEGRGASAPSNPSAGRSRQGALIMSDSPKPLGAIYSNPRRKQDGSTTPRSGGDRSVGRPEGRGASAPSNPSAGRSRQGVYSGHMGNDLYRRRKHTRCIFGRDTGR